MYFLQFIKYTDENRSRLGNWEIFATLSWGVKMTLCLVFTLIKVPLYFKSLNF